MVYYVLICCKETTHTPHHYMRVVHNSYRPTAPTYVELLTPKLEHKKPSA